MVVAIYDSDWYIKRLNDIEIDKKRNFGPLSYNFWPQSVAPYTCLPYCKPPRYGPESHLAPLYILIYDSSVASMQQIPLLKFLDRLHWWPNPSSTTLKANTLTITPQMTESIIYHTRGEHTNHYTTDDRIHHLPH